MICPVCQNVDTLTRISVFDEEGCEGWECEVCENWWLGDWEEPPAADSAPFRRWGDMPEAAILAWARIEWKARTTRKAPSQPGG